MNKKCGVIIVLLLAVIFGGAYKFLVQGSVAEGKDGRVVILLDASERLYILGEMRSLLGHMQELVTAISNDDMDNVIKVAETLVNDSSGKTPARIIAKMPLAFKQISISIHSDFKQLLAESKEKRDTKLALKQLSKIMQNCLACHATHSLMPKQ
ncbi:MAG TPA: hypothetical protein EYG68_06910 [Leucothrix mucor]|nr:hypothetical protein [Leucothrix mucor]